MTLSLPVAAIHQIEITSRCNLACRYCVHPKNMPRAKMDIDHADWLKALDLVSGFVKAGTQHELNLCGIGESTMHPRFVEYVAMAREAVGERVSLTLATNGLLMTEDMARDLVPFHPMIWVSLHRPEKAAHAVNALRKVGLLSGISADPSLSSVNWAGQVEWPVTAAQGICPWVVNGRAFLMADGRLSRCCFDSDGSGTICHVQELDRQETTPYHLCASCHQHHPVVEAQSHDGTQG